MSLILSFERQITYYLFYIINRMYSHSQKGNKQENKPSVFDLAEKIQRQTEGRNEALQIMNAYRKVQALPIPSNNLSKKQKELKPQQRKPESQYANKVKQTLKQMNANRKKQLQSNKAIQKPLINQKINGLGSAERHLIQNGLKRFIKIFDKIYGKNMQESLKKILKAGTILQQTYQKKLRVWKLKRIFSGWQYEAMLSKIQKQRIKNLQVQKQRRSLRIAIDFNYFWTVKKIFRNWNTETKRTLKKRQFQLQQQLKRQQQIKQLQEKNKILQIQKQKTRRVQVQPNLNLQNKIRGFIDGLKNQIQGKQRLNTIKQKTQQSRLQRDRPQISEQQLYSEFQQQNNQTSQNTEQPQLQMEADNQINEPQGPLTNQDLQKRRKQLQKKAKQRKQALQKLKKQRQKKKKQEQQQKLAIEKQIQQQQKKLRQQQYRKFAKQRKQEQEWKIKQKQLQKQATQFDRLRLMKFYGWIFWAKLKTCNQTKAEQIQKLLTKIVLKRKLQNFINKATEVAQQKMKKIQQRAYKHYCKKLKAKCVKKLKQYKKQQKQLKQQLNIRHEVFTAKIYFKQWLRVRNMIQLQNYEWERPRIKRAQCLYSMTLLHKSIQALKINKDQQIQNRNIQQHKAKIKQKVHQIVQEKPTINYDDFL